MSNEQIVDKEKKRILTTISNLCKDNEYVFATQEKVIIKGAENTEVFVKENDTWVLNNDDSLSG